MVRPRGRTKTVRLTVNLGDHAYAALLAIVGREDAPVAQRAIADFLSREEPSFEQQNLPLTVSPDDQGTVR